MNRYTYYGSNGNAYLRASSSTYQEAVNRFAELEDSVEEAEEILKDINVQKELEKNKLELHPLTHAIAVSGERYKKILEIQQKFSDLFYFLDDVSIGNREKEIAFQHLEEALYWINQSIKRE